MADIGIYRDPRDVLDPQGSRRSIASGLIAGAGRGIKGAPTATELETAPGTPSANARSAAYAVNRPRGSVFDAPDLRTVSGQVGEQPTIAGPSYADRLQAAASTSTVPSIGQMPSVPTSTQARGIGDISPANIMPPQPPAPLMPTDSSAPATAAAPVTNGINFGGGTTATNAEVQKAAQALDAYGPGPHNADGTGGSSGFRDSATEERNARLPRQNQLAALDSAARLATSPRERAAAIGAYAQLAGTQDQDNAQLDIGKLKDSGETTRSNATNRTSLTREQMANATTSRGQDIGLQTHVLGNKSAIDVANIGADSRAQAAQARADGAVAAADARAQRYAHGSGGSRIEMVNGMPVTVRDPDFVIDQTTGQIVQQAAQQPKSIATDPKALAIKNNAALSLDEKRAQLKALGYQ